MRMSRSVLEEKDISYAFVWMGLKRHLRIEEEKMKEFMRWVVRLMVCLGGAKPRPGQAFFNQAGSAGALNEHKISLFVVGQKAFNS